MNSTSRPLSIASFHIMQKKSTSTPPSFSIFLWDAMIISLLVAAIIGSALSVAFQVHKTREEFKVLRKSKQVGNRLDVEWGRLLIEQQTFGATTQIGSRALIYLHMYSPPASQTITLTLPDARQLSKVSSLNSTALNSQKAVSTHQGVAP
jgi:cell division protein FtsL